VRVFRGDMSPKRPGATLAAEPFTGCGLSGQVDLGGAVNEFAGGDLDSGESSVELSTDDRRTDGDDGSGSLNGEV